MGYEIEDDRIAVLAAQKIRRGRPSDELVEGATDAPRRPAARDDEDGFRPIRGPEEHIIALARHIGRPCSHPLIRTRV